VVAASATISAAFEVGLLVAVLAAVVAVLAAEGRAEAAIIAYAVRGQPAITKWLAVEYLVMAFRAAKAGGPFAGALVPPERGLTRSCCCVFG
jgi:hypothetical protein